MSVRVLKIIKIDCDSFENRDPEFITKVASFIDEPSISAEIKLIDFLKSYKEQKVYWSHGKLYPIFRIEQEWVK